MKISLRPHHLLCLQGYKGLNYSKGNALSWAKISETLKQTPQSDILIIKGSDELCSGCPAIQNQNSARCIEKSVNALDNKVKKILKIRTGETYKYKDIVNKMNEIMTPEKHKELCSKCAWWIKGLCQNSFGK